MKDIKKDILDTKESIVKEGKELDEFIEKSNDEIMKGEKMTEVESSMNFFDHIKELRQKLIYVIIFL